MFELSSPAQQVLLTFQSMTLLITFHTTTLLPLILFTITCVLWVFLSIFAFGERTMTCLDFCDLQMNIIKL